MSAASRPSSQEAAVVAMVDKLREHGSWTGQTHLQKTLYFCQAMLGLPLDFDFVLYKHGPYSPTLERSIHRLEGDSTLAFVSQQPPYRPRLVTSEGAEVIRENEPEVLADYDEALEFVAVAMGRKSIKELERIATALWFKVCRPGAEPDEVAALVHEIKPHIPLEQALRAFHEVKALEQAAGHRGLIRGQRAPTALARRESRMAGAERSLIIDVASSSRRLPGDELELWGQSRTVFVSSEMSELAGHRVAVAEALRGLGLRVVMFEDLGGVDDGAQRVYLDGVAQADIYLGIVGDSYGTMLRSGRSPTHEEYREARRRGKRISFWVAEDDQNRQGNAADFVDEVRVFHTTGRFTTVDNLCQRLNQRIAEMAADDEAPWIKIGETCLRATRIRYKGGSLVVTADVRDLHVAHALEDLQAEDGKGATAVRIATSDRAGEARNVIVESEYRNVAVRAMKIHAEVVWAPARLASTDVSVGGYSADDLIELELRAGLLGETLPSVLSEAGIIASDPLADLVGRSLSHSTQQSVAALILSDWLIGRQRASRIDRFTLGPPHLGKQRLELLYTEPRRGNEAPGMRRVEGVRKAL